MKLALSILLAFTFQIAFAQGLSKNCVEELLAIPENKENFILQDFLNELPATVVKVKAQAKVSGFLNPIPDDNVTDIGITVGCAKTFPEKPKAMQALIRDLHLEITRGAIAKKLEVEKDSVPMDIDSIKHFAIDKGWEDVLSIISMPLNSAELDYSNIKKKEPIQEIESGIESEKGKDHFGLALTLDLIGAGFIVYGIVKDIEASRNYDEYESIQSRNTQSNIDKAWGKVKTAQSSRNFAYTVGVSALALGIGVHLWF